ncbi:SgcJ/EcaC family oxidoreductase [Dankookia sp. GCM10030260]|uniref:SgcJ/EcaC family oxidoreductase n=1 Tax=Dankookia sp. GCM10030260 TaxID=3273390 RepID=UPI003620540C
MISTDDEKAIKNLGHAFKHAWNTHNMDELAAIVTPGIDFVHVRGGWLGGRDVVRKYHAALHGAQFRNSTLRIEGMSIRPLTPDICICHVNWGMSDETNPDGTPRQPRESIFTWVVHKMDGHWLIDAAHNTNIDPQVVTSTHRKPVSP